MATRTVDEETGTTIYRSGQVGLTEVARHSEARHVGVTLDLDENKRSGTTLARLTVEDDCRGLPQDFEFGFGRLGMTGCVRKLGVASVSRTAGPRARASNRSCRSRRAETEVFPEAAS